MSCREWRQNSSPRHQKECFSIWSIVSKWSFLSSIPLSLDFSRDQVFRMWHTPVCLSQIWSLILWLHLPQTTWTTTSCFFSNWLWSTCAGLFYNAHCGKVWVLIQAVVDDIILLLYGMHVRDDWRISDPTLKLVEVGSTIIRILSHVAQQIRELFCSQSATLSVVCCSSGVASFTSNDRQYLILTS